MFKLSWLSVGDSQSVLIMFVHRMVSFRFPSLFPTLEPEFVAKEIVAGTLRDEPIIIIPRSVVVNFALLG